MRWVTVTRVFSPAEAQLLRSRLEASGFPVNVAHELASLSLEGYSMAAGGVEVQVPESELEAARELLSAREEGAE